MIHAHELRLDELLRAPEVLLVNQGGEGLFG